MPASLFYFDKGGLLREIRSWAEAESVNSFRTILGADASTGGAFKPIARAKTKSQIVEKMVDMAKERARGKKLHGAINHANAPEQAERLKGMLLSRLQCDELHICQALAATAIKAGEGLIEFEFYSD